jgi:Protein of unknown function (DUF1800)
MPIRPGGARPKTSARLAAARLKSKRKRHTEHKAAQQRTALEKQHRRKQKHKRKHHKRKHAPKHLSKHRNATPTHAPVNSAIGAPSPIVTPNPPPPSNDPPPAYGTSATVAQIRRLLWRAGFGPLKGQAESLAGQPLEQIVLSQSRPSGPAVLSGPAPTDSDGNPLAPADSWGHDHCWWLDRMVRSDQQLIERMTFIWHDWFANSNDQVNSQQQMLDQNQLFRTMALGSFRDLFQAVTINPAMLLFLNGTSNSKWDPNENYAREMMELFSLGADRGAYTEDDVREMARALTGWRNDWSAELGNHNFRFDPSYHDSTSKTVFGQTGKFNYLDAVNLCVNHPLHPSFFVTKLWGYFIPTVPDTQTLASLQGVYVNSNFNIGAVVEAILQHPDFYVGPEMVTPPVVFNAGLLRAIERYIDTTDWVWLSSQAGQQLFYPPNVAGWDFSRWLDTSTVKGRWDISTYVTSKTYPNPWPAAGQPVYDALETPQAALASALDYWGNPIISADSLAALASFAATCLPANLSDWQQSPYRAIRQNALRMLIATAPDLQVS